VSKCQSGMISLFVGYLSLLDTFLCWVTSRGLKKFCHEETIRAYSLTPRFLFDDIEINKMNIYPFDKEIIKMNIYPFDKVALDHGCSRTFLLKKLQLNLETLSIAFILQNKFYHCAFVNL